MNIKVQHLISDIEGVAGMILLRAIAQGIKDPQALVGLIEADRLKATEEELIVSLSGMYKPQYVAILQHALKAYDFYKEEMKQYELLIEDVLQKMLPEDKQGKKPQIAKKKGLVRKNQYSINLKQYLENILGTDVTQVDGLDEITVLEIISVTGADMSKWPTAEHFTSWLNLAPLPKKAGGKLLGHQKRFTNNTATQAFRLAAQTMWRNKGGLGNLYRRLAAQKGSKKAIKALARKLAVIFYHMVKNKTSYDKERVNINQQQQEKRKVERLKRLALSYGLVLQSIKDTSL